MDNNKKVVHEFMKNAGEKVRFELSKFRDKNVVSIRVYYNAGIGKEDWNPSYKGITTSADHLPELKKGIDLTYKIWKQETERTD